MVDPDQSIESVVLTVDDEGAPLDEALDYFARTAFTADNYRSECGSYLAVSIGDPKVAAHLDDRLESLDAFLRQMAEK